jgi:hypothetical protein
VDRTKTEITLARDRAWALETWSAIDPEMLVAPCTVSGADPDFWWTAKDHFAHLVSVEKMFTRMVTAFVDGTEQAVGAVIGDIPRARRDASSAADVFNDRWTKKHHDTPFEELVVLGERARTATYELLARIPDDLFEAQVPGAMWDGGSVGSMVCVAYGRHGRQHWAWVEAGWKARATA